MEFDLLHKKYVNLKYQYFCNQGIVGEEIGLQDLQQVSYAFQNDVLSQQTEVEIDEKIPNLFLVDCLLVSDQHEAMFNLVEVPFEINKINLQQSSDLQENGIGSSNITQNIHKQFNFQSEQGDEDFISVFPFVFHDLVARFMEMHWIHRFYIFDFIKDDFHNCKKGLLFHACFYSLVSLTIYMLKGERKM